QSSSSFFSASSCPRLFVTRVAHPILLLPFFFLLLPRPPSSTLFPYTTLFRSRTAGDRTGPSAGGSGQRAGDLHRHAAQLAESLWRSDGPGQQTEPGAKAHPGAGSREPQPAQAAGRERRGHRRLKKIRRHPVKTVEERYRCVQTLKRQGASVEQACRVLEVSRSGYYGWKAEKICRRRLQNQALRRRLIELHEKYPALGLDSLYRLLKPEFGCSRKRVHRQMRLAGISSVRRRAYKKTTHSNHSHPITPNLLQRNFSFDRPDQAWVGDITY